MGSLRKAARLKILQILYYATPYTSGLTIYADRLARHMTQRGHQVTTLASRHNDDLPTHETTTDAGTIVRVPVSFTFDRAVVMPRLVPTAVRLMRRHDVVHIHLPVAETALLVALGRMLGKRVILTHHSDLVLTGGLLSHLGAQAGQWSGILGGRLANTVVTYTVSRAAVSPTIRRLGNRHVIVSPPVEIDQPSPDARQRFRAAHNLGPGPVIGFVGRYAVEKGIDILLQTIPRIQERWPGAVYAIAGPCRDARDGSILRGKWDPWIERFRPAIRQLDSLHGQDLADFYAACDVTVLPSINWTETFGLVQVESMLCGTPVVASDLPGVREPVATTGFGRLAIPGNVSDLATQIVEVIANREQYVRSADAVKARYSLEASIDAYERLYRGEAVSTPVPANDPAR
jgi:glycosyltransferase involved in cell wall biosynthesis